MFIFGQIESDRVATAAAVSVVLLAISLVVLLGDLGALALGGAGMTARPHARALGAARRSRSAIWSLLLAAPVGLVFYRTFEHGFGAAWDAVTTPEAHARLLADDR